MILNPAVDIRDIHKTYGAVQALQGVSFTIQQGEFFGLLGPNGAGKSTLINIMAGLTRATSGEVRIMNHHVERDYRKARQAIGVVPQELVFDPFFTVREFLRLQAGYFGYGPENHAWIDELIESLELNDKAHTTLRKLSGGMKRRVLIAQALVHRPRVVVLDEPTAGVDVALRQTLWALTQKLHKEGHTILLTTHYLEEAETLCERIAILNKGEVCALENKSALIAKYPQRVVRIVCREENIEAPVRVRKFLLAQEGSAFSFSVNKAQDSVGDLLQAFYEQGIGILDVETNAPGLEDIFLDIIAAGKKT